MIQNFLPLFETNQNFNQLDYLLNQNKQNFYKNPNENTELILNLLQNSQVFSAILNKNPILTQYFTNSRENLEKKEQIKPVVIPNKNQCENYYTPFKRAATHVAIAYFVYIKSVVLFVLKILNYPKIFNFAFELFKNNIKIITINSFHIGYQNIFL